MQTFNKTQPIWLTYISLLIVTIIALWLSQNSINAYWVQTYHQDSPLVNLSHYKWWHEGGVLQQRANERYQNIKRQVEDITFVEPPLPEPKNYRQDPNFLLANSLAATALKPKLEPVQQPQIIQQSEIIIEHNDETQSAVQKNAELDNGKMVYLDPAKDKVFFAGDSLMQGVAPHVQKWLKGKYNIQSVNLSKQSTGLSYPSFFDWPKTIETTLQSDPSIKLLVVFLGANDPWDFANPEKRSMWLKFKSPEWENVYVQRIERIFKAAQQHKVRVIWLGVPHMRSPKLNEQMKYLEKVYQANVAPKAIFLPTEALLSGGTGQYTDSINYNGKSTKVRSKDGIHFTVAGQRILADYIQQHIAVK